MAKQRSTLLHSQEVVYTATLTGIYSRKEMKAFPLHHVVSSYNSSVIYFGGLPNV